jgi:hypothetical protein
VLGCGWFKRYCAGIRPDGIITVISKTGTINYWVIIWGFNIYERTFGGKSLFASCWVNDKQPVVLNKRIFGLMKGVKAGWEVQLQFGVAFGCGKIHLNGNESVRRCNFTILVLQHAVFPSCCGLDPLIYYANK